MMLTRAKPPTARATMIGTESFLVLEVEEGVVEIGFCFLSGWLDWFFGVAMLLL